MLFLFVCLHVCHAGCPGKRSGRSTIYNVTVVCRAVSMRFSLFFTERNELFNRLQRFHLHHQMAPQCSTESAKVLKNFQKLTEKFVSTTQNIQGQHIIKVSSGLCSCGIIDVHLYKFFRQLFTQQRQKYSNLPKC